jgi:hypothetical protein
MVAPLVGLAKAYALNEAKNYATSKAEEALGLPKDSIALATNPMGFAKNIVKDVAKDYAKNEFLGRDAIPEEDRSFSSSGGGGSQPYTDDELTSGRAAYKRGGKVKNTASRRGDGIAQRGKTKGRYL